MRHLDINVSHGHMEGEIAAKYSRFTPLLESTVPFHKPVRGAGRVGGARGAETSKGHVLMKTDPATLKRVYAMSLLRRPRRRD
jgi:hypothetical protein